MKQTHRWLRRHAHRAYDAIVVGGGVIGAAVANKLSERGAKRVLVLDKEPTVGTHQTGHGDSSCALELRRAISPSFSSSSSTFWAIDHHDGRAGGAGVLHSGVFCPPGSVAASRCVIGSERWRKFCDDEGVRWEPRMKLIVAACEEEARALEDWFDKHATVAAHRRAAGIEGANNIRSVKGTIYIILVSHPYFV